MSVEVNVELGADVKASTEIAVETTDVKTSTEVAIETNVKKETEQQPESNTTKVAEIEPLTTTSPEPVELKTQSTDGDKQPEVTRGTTEEKKEVQGEKEEGNEGEHTVVGDALSKVKKFSNMECVAFFIFLIIFCVMVALSRGTDDTPYIQTAAIRNRLTIEKYADGFNPNFDRQLQDTNQVMDIWNYLRDVALKILLTETTMGGLPNNKTNGTERFYPLGQARLLGGVRFRQTRNKPKQCAIAHTSFPVCWSSTVDTADFVGKFGTYKYQKSSELEDQSWRAKFNSYEGGGYVHDFPLDYKQAVDEADILQQGDWIDRGTAFVCIDFNLYNPTTNYHTIGRIAFEMPIGGVFPYFEIKTWKFLRYADSQGKALIAMQVLWVLLVVYFTVIMFTEMFREGCSCSKSGYWGKTRWRILDVINYGFFYGAIFVYIANEAYRHGAGHDWKNINKFRSFRKLQYFFLSETYILALNGFLSFFKLFKYFSVNRRLKFFFTMLGKAGQDLLMFLLVLIIFFFGFGFCGFMAFSSDVDDFRSLIFAFFNMIRFVIGDVNYAALQLSSRTWGSVYYVSWSILMLLVLTNVFIAILSEAYGDTIEDMSEEDRISLGFFGMRGAMVKLQKMFQNLRNVGLSELDEDGDGQLDARELANKTGWTTEEAQKFIDEHDKDNNGKLSEKEWEALVKESEEKKNQGGVGDSRLSAMVTVSPGVGGAGGRLSVGLGRSSLINSQISTQQYQQLTSKVKLIEELLRAQLHQTKAGTKALKEIENKQKSSRKNIRADSTDNVQLAKEK